MNRMYRFGAILFSTALLSAALAGCATTESAPAETAPETTTEVQTETATETTTETAAHEVPDDLDVYTVTDSILEATGIAGDTVVAMAGDVEITAAEFLYQAAYMADSYQSYTYSFGNAYFEWDSEISDGVTVDEMVRMSAMDSAVFYAVMGDIAKVAGVTLSEEEQASLDGVYDGLVESLGSEEAVNLTLIYSPLTLDYYKQIQENGYYASILVTDMLSEGGELDLSDEEQLWYAEDELGMYGAKHILFLTLDNTGVALSEEDKADKLAQAQDALAQLEESSDPIALFDTLMNELSEDGRDATTGALYSPDGYSATAGQMVESFEEAALALDVGEISGLVESEYGYHIILRTPLTLDDTVRSNCENGLIIDLEESWLADYPVVTNENYDLIDLEVFYDNLNKIRVFVGLELQTLLKDVE